MLKNLLIATLLVIALPFSAVALDGDETYDLLFRKGTLNDVSQGSAMVYERKVENTLKPEAAERDSGMISLSFSGENNKLTSIRFTQEEKHRNLGRFPTSVGNPMIMVFYESVIRDMAETAGGSPFYIRNRVKDALIQPSEIEKGSALFEGKNIPTQTIRLYPFAKDPNRDRMKGFGDLELSVTMSEAVPGWYLGFVANVPAQEGETPVYQSRIVFHGMENAQ